MRLIAVAALLALAGVALARHGRPDVYKIALSGSQEVSGGDTAAYGYAFLTFNKLENTLCYKLMLESLTSAPTAAHIHQAAAGANGNVFISLGLGINGLEACVPITREEYMAIKTNPTGFYVNVHTSTHPSGAVRGQLTSICPNTAGKSSLGFDLVASGDVDGSARVELKLRNQQLCWNVFDFNTETPTAAHVHRKNVNSTTGPPVVNFNPSVNGLCGCVEVPDKSLRKSIRSGDDSLYVNLHSAANPSGTVRGELSSGVTVFPEPTKSIYVSMTAAESVPAGDQDAFGYASFDFYRGIERVCFTLDIANLDQTPTAAHIHTGVAGATGGVFVNLNIGTVGLKGCVAASKAAINSILDNPANFYVNVHNPAFPAGAIRGQLEATCEKIGGRFGLDLALTGSGSGNVKLGMKGNRVCFIFSDITGIGTPTAAHIHKKNEGQNTGGVVVNLDIPNNGLCGCVQVNDGGLRRMIRQASGELYVNVHTAAEPAGAIRADLDQ